MPASQNPAYNSNFYAGYTSNHYQPGPSLPNIETQFQHVNPMGHVIAPNKDIQKASSEISNTFSDDANDEKVIVIHEHHHHHHHKNVTDRDDTHLHYDEYDDERINVSDKEANNLTHFGNHILTNNALANLLSILIDGNTDDYFYEDDGDQGFFDEENNRRSAVFEKKKKDERKYKRIAEIYRELYSDYYTAYVRKAGYEEGLETADDGVEKFIENGYQPIVEIELDL